MKARRSNSVLVSRPPPTMIPGPSRLFVANETAPEDLKKPQLKRRLSLLTQAINYISPPSLKQKSTNISQTITKSKSFRTSSPSASTPRPKLSSMKSLNLAYNKVDGEMKERTDEMKQSLGRSSKENKTVNVPVNSDSPKSLRSQPSPSISKKLQESFQDMGLPSSKRAVESPSRLTRSPSISSVAKDYPIAKSPDLFSQPIPASAIHASLSPVNSIGDINAHAHDSKHHLREAIPRDELNSLIHEMSAISCVENKLLYLEEKKGDYLFSSDDLLSLLDVTASIKTKIEIISIVGPLLTDPKARSAEILGIFRFAEQREKVSEILKFRTQNLNSAIFSRNSAILPPRPGSGAGRGPCLPISASDQRPSLGGGRGSGIRYSNPAPFRTGSIPKCVSASCMVDSSSRPPCSPRSQSRGRSSSIDAAGSDTHPKTRAKSNSALQSACDGFDPVSKSFNVNRDAIESEDIISELRDGLQKQLSLQSSEAEGDANKLDDVFLENVFINSRRSSRRHSAPTDPMELKDDFFDESFILNGKGTAANSDDVSPVIVDAGDKKMFGSYPVTPTRSSRYSTGLDTVSYSEEGSDIMNQFARQRMSHRLSNSDPRARASVRDESPRAPLTRAQSSIPLSSSNAGVRFRSMLRDGNDESYETQSETRIFSRAPAKSVSVRDSYLQRIDEETKSKTKIDSTRSASRPNQVGKVRKLSEGLNVKAQESFRNRQRSSTMQSDLTLVLGPTELNDPRNYLSMKPQSPIGYDSKLKIHLFSHNELARRHFCKDFDGVCETSLENHLTDDEFYKLFHMSKIQFTYLPKWKQSTLKKNALIF